VTGEPQAISRLWLQRAQRGSASRTLDTGADQYYGAIARYRVASPIPISREIARHEVPHARRAAILEASTTRQGRPRRFPFTLAFRRPAFTRSWISARSHSAMAPMIWNINRPEGVLRSKVVPQAHEPHAVGRQINTAC